MLNIRIFIIALCAFINFADAKKVPSIKTPPQWSKVYTVKGVLSIPYSELREPFYAWYDETNGRSRIDYYGGMVKTYQLSKVAVGDHGSSIKIAPITTESVENQQTCLQVNGSSEMEISVQSILPDLNGFEYLGQETFGDSQTEKWRLVDTIGDKVNKYTIWIKYRKNWLQQASEPIPVRYEMRGFNSLLGSHYHHYYLDYEDYSINEIEPNIFTVDTDMKCISFPGPGADHVYTFNPMGEFVRPTNTKHVDKEFYRFMRKHGRKYADELEETDRKTTFNHNMRLIHSINRANLGYSLTVNHLTDKTDLELRVLRGRRFTTDNNGADRFPYTSEDVARYASLGVTPKEFDWRLLGAVTPVKDQSVCGSCWSFGTIGAIEGAYFLHNGGHLFRLSQQALIDCSWGYGNNGCDGGEDFRAYQWMMKHGGIPLEDEYGGYLGQDGYCHANNVTLYAPIKGYVNVTANSEDALRLAIFKHGPISVAIDASHKTFSFYSNGVYFEPKCGNKIDELDHAVLAVGYGSINGQNYWLVKNSWSNYWGNDGYVLMSSKSNNCGVETTPTYVVM